MLLQNIRAKIGARLNGDSEGGFTLIELLVVMLILGILAAIALPAFFNQKSKAGDAKAKENLHTAQVAMETCGVNANNSYSSCTKVELEKVEPTISGMTGLTVAEPAAPAGGYTLTATGDGTHSFVLKREGSGATETQGKLDFSCTPVGEGGCPANGNWGS
jgi:type IV pilus assembly protein PilA